VVGQLLPCLVWVESHELTDEVVVSEIDQLHDPAVQVEPFPLLEVVGVLPSLGGVLHLAAVVQVALELIEPVARGE